MIKIENISKRFDSFELNKITLEIPEGEYVVLLGDSGSGKSVLLEIIAGLIKPDQGSIFLNDQDLTDEPIRSRPFGMVFQDLALFPHLSVYENIAYPLKTRHLSKSDISIKIRELSEKLEITHILDRYPPSLSGGERQRVALARTLAIEPACLLLDEPLASVDARIRKEIKSVLRKLHHSGQTIIHVTHDYQEAVSLASRIGILENGKLIQYGPALEVLRNPVSPFMASFTGIRNFIPVTLGKDPVDGHLKAWTEQKIPLIFQTEKDHGKGYLIIPEDAVFLSTMPVLTSAANQLKGIITDIIPAIHGLEVVVDVGFPLHALLTADSIHRLSLKQGDTVHASFKATALRFIRK
ncbi:MAG: ABC transporter ATP-binding protein [Bacteroidales bacterium]